MLLYPSLKFKCQLSHHKNRDVYVNETQIEHKKLLCLLLWLFSSNQKEKDPVFSNEPNKFQY